MARPQKEGLDYFPLDVDMDQDDKLFFIEAKHGLIGFAIVVRLLMQIYKEGYYKHYDDNKDAFLFAKRLSVDVNVIKNVVNDCINEGFFNKDLYEKYGILTSRGIQKRYFEACARRKKVSIIKEYCLIDPKNYKNIVFEYINPINVDINPDKCNITSVETPQSKVNKIYSSSSSYSDPPGKVFQFYQENIGFLSSHQAEVLNSYLDDGLEPELIIEAMKDSLGSDNKWKYLCSILQNCIKSNILTLTQYNAAKVEHKNKSKSRDPTISAPAPLKTWAEIKEEQFQKNTREVIEKLKKEGYFDDG